MSEGQRPQVKEAVASVQRLQDLASGRVIHSLAVFLVYVLGAGQIKERPVACSRGLKPPPERRPGLVPTSTMVQSGCVPTWPSALENHVSGLHSLEAGNCSR